MTVVNIHFLGVIMCSQLSLASQVVHPFLFLQKSLLCCSRLVGWWLLLMLDWKKIQPWIGNTHAHTREHALIFSGGPLFTSSITLATLAAGSFHCATTCRRGKEKKRNCNFHSRDKGDGEGRVGAGVGATGEKGLKKKFLLINVGFEAPLLLDPPLHGWRLPRGREGMWRGKKSCLSF